MVRQQLAVGLEKGYGAARIPRPYVNPSMRNFEDIPMYNSELGQPARATVRIG